MTTEVKPGHFIRAGVEYIALSHVPGLIDRPARFVENAIQRGELGVYELCGCKTVPLVEILGLHNEQKRREGGEHEQ